jgi:hypothetical protein
MTASKNQKDFRILSPLDLIATAGSDTGLQRRRTSRDVLPGGYMAALAPVLVHWKASRILDEDPFVILRNVNYGGKPVSKKIRFSECRLVIDFWGQENREIQKAMHGRHLRQILIQTKLNRPAIVTNSGEGDYR